MNGETCGNCKFAFATKKLIAKGPRGLSGFDEITSCVCRRYPKRQDVALNHWCGEWTAKPRYTDEVAP